MQQQEQEQGQEEEEEEEEMEEEWGWQEEGCRGMLGSMLGPGGKSVVPGTGRAIV